MKAVTTIVATATVAVLGAALLVGCDDDEACAAGPGSGSGSSSSGSRSSGSTYRAPSAPRTAPRPAAPPRRPVVTKTTTHHHSGPIIIVDADGDGFDDNTGEYGGDC